MDFLTELKKRKAEGIFPVIPDIKCFSPKEGDLIGGRDPAVLAKELESAGACVLSVVTETTEFHGSMEILRDICSSVRIPVLRKDFIETEDDLIITKEAGASAILLMYSCLGKEKLEFLYKKTLQTGLVPFVETHTAQELKWAGELGAQLVGINNRDILDLERDEGDVSTSENLICFRPGQAFLVVESGLRHGADVRRAVRCGADAALVGTAILRDPDPASMYRAMTRPCSLKICGLMDRKGILLCRRHHVDVVGFVTEYPVPVRWNLNREEASQLLRFAKQPLSADGQLLPAGRDIPDGQPASAGQYSSAGQDLPDGRSASARQYSSAGQNLPDGQPASAGQYSSAGQDLPDGRSASAGQNSSAGQVLPDGRSASARQYSSAGPAPETCIVTGGSPEKVISLARELRPDYVQLHYKETASETARITEALHREGIRIIRSIPSDPEQRSQMFGTPDPEQIAALLQTASVDALLIDSRDGGNAAKGGGPVTLRMNSDTLKKIRRFYSGPVFLGGGLTSSNIRDTVRAYRPDLADVMTGVEISPGEKSESLLAALTAGLETPE